MALAARYLCSIWPLATRVRKTRSPSLPKRLLRLASRFCRHRVEQMRGRGQPGAWLACQMPGWHAQCQCTLVCLLMDNRVSSKDCVIQGGLHTMSKG